MHTHKPPILADLGENITAIVVTGGPCGGKSSGLARASSALADRGYKVLVSPESATKLITAGMNPGELQPEIFQEEILRDVLAQESRFHSIATRYRDLGRKVVILLDRGVMDGKAYVDSPTWNRLIARLGHSENELCDERYHAALHMQTAAIGAEKFYTLANNTARRESLEEARQLDQQTLDAWTRHRHPRVIDNSVNFDQKIHNLLVEICSILGDPLPLEQERKFLVRQIDAIPQSIHVHESEIEQTYLLSPGSGEERRVRARIDSAGSASYYYTVKKYLWGQLPSLKTCIEEEQIITYQEYCVLLTMHDPRMRTIRKKRRCFFWKNRFYEVDDFIEPNKDTLMEIEYSDSLHIRQHEMPAFFEVIREVTDDVGYSNASIAQNWRRGGIE